MVQFSLIETYINPSIKGYFLDGNGFLNNILWNQTINQIESHFKVYYPCFDASKDIGLLPELAIVFNYFNRWKAGESDADTLDLIIKQYDTWLATAKEKGAEYCELKNGLPQYTNNLLIYSKRGKNRWE